MKGTTNWHSPRMTMWAMYSLCGQSSMYFTHPLAWEETIKSLLMQIDAINEVCCACKACEMKIKRNVGEENCQSCWRARASKKGDEYIAPVCNTTHGIIHTALVPTTTSIRIASCYTLTESTEKQLTPLCQVHYKKIHHILHANAAQSHYTCF